VKKKKRLKTRGEKLDMWETTREILKLRFAAAGVTSCELRYEGCSGNNLSFGHSKKRRYIQSQEELEKVISACQNCHDFIEYKPGKYEIVRRAIASRRIPVGCS
jgi:hypothetical protein